MKAEQKRKYGLIAVLVLAALGVGFSIELLSVHLAVATDASHSASCDINQQVSCSAVALSRWASLLGVPVPVWGILTYLVFGVLAILGLKVKKAPLNGAGDYVLPLAAWSVLYSAFLAYIAAFVVKTLCIFCASLYAVNLGLLIAGLFAASPLEQYVARRRQDWNRLRANPSAMGFVFGALAMAIGLCIFLYIRSGRIVVEPAPGVKIDLSHDPMVGPARAPLTIIEFSDYECPACRKMHPTIQALLKEYPDTIKIYYKNFPLNPDCNSKVKFRLHEYACGAAAAAECAFAMGKFAEVSDQLWTTNDLSLPGLLRIAAGEGLDTAAFQECLVSSETHQRIMEDVDAGIRLEINATPTFIVNGIKFSGYKTVEEARKIIEDVIAGKDIPAETPPPR